MSTLFTDMRFVLRLMRRSPGFFGALIAVLVAGIGATTAMFSLVYSLLLRPLPYTHPEELTMIWATQPLVDPSPVSLPDFLDWKAEATTFDHMAAVDYMGYTLTAEGTKPEMFSGAGVSGDYFPMLGIKPLRGRLLTPNDDRQGAPPVAVLRADLWHNRFGSDPQIVGRAITLNSESVTVVGVAPEGFRYSGPNSDGADIWTPLALTPYYEGRSKQRGTHFLHVMGRRKAGVTLQQAETQLVAIAKRIEAQHPDMGSKCSARVVGLQDELVGKARGPVSVLFAAVALVFLIVCANVANLLLTRAEARRGEMATRAALGATRSRLVGQLVVETTIVFAIGAAGGVALSYWLVNFFASNLVHGSGAATIDVRVDLVTLLLCVATSLVCGALFGLVPALSLSHVEPQTVLKETSTRAGGGRSQHLMRGSLVVAQVALAFALLSGAGLALRAFARVLATSPGFEPNNLAMVRIWLPRSKYKDDAQVETFFQNAVRHIATQPGVDSVAANSLLPMGGSNSDGGFRIEGRPPSKPGESPLLNHNEITPDYFRTMGMPILRGRDFTDADRSGSRLVTIVSQSVVDRFFPGEDPIGRRIDLEDAEEPEWREIVGVVPDVRRRGLSGRIGAEGYFPMAQRPSRTMAVVVRSKRAEQVLRDMPTWVAAIDPEQAVSRSSLMVKRVADTVGDQRTTTTLLFAFAVSALVLATLGIFALVSYATSQRTRELGIRLALGATPGAVVILVMRSGMRLVSIGLALGLVGAIFVGRVLASRIAGVASFDALTIVVIAVVLLVAGALASFLPALRAVRIPPATALRYE